MGCNILPTLSSFGEGNITLRLSDRKTFTINTVRFQRESSFPRERLQESFVGLLMLFLVCVDAARLGLEHLFSVRTVTVRTISLRPG